MPNTFGTPADICEEILIHYFIISLENWNFLVDGVQRDPPEDCDSMMQHNNVNTEPFREDEELEFPHKKSSAPGASILSVSESPFYNQIKNAPKTHF